MKKVSIDAPLEYIVGHLRYGHFEGELEMTDEEFEEFKKNPLDFLYKEDYINDLNLVIDDYEVDDIGPVDEVNWTEWTSV